MQIFSTGWSIDKDGPGQRLVIYLKGCNMRCRWCASPESIAPQPQILFYPDRSAAPVDGVCPRGAIHGQHLDRAVCDTCGSCECVNKWRSRSLERVGKSVSPAQLAEQILEVRGLFHPDGGVTFGGGEPSLQTPEILETLALLKPHAIHTAIESNASTEAFRLLIGRLDLVICDLKCVSPERHKDWTGIDNQLILENLRHAARKQAQLLIRIPLVPGLNTGECAEEQRKMIEFLSTLRQQRESLHVEILRMHHLGEPKYAALGWDYPMRGVVVPPPEAAEALGTQLLQKGIQARWT